VGQRHDTLVSKEPNATAKAWRGEKGHWKSRVKRSLLTRPNCKRRSAEVEVMGSDSDLKEHRVRVIGTHKLEILDGRHGDSPAEAEDISVELRAPARSFVLEMRKIPKILSAE
jgi:hypothetical protein